LEPGHDDWHRVVAVRVSIFFDEVLGVRDEELA
jgi:hypothetical protein